MKCQICKTGVLKKQRKIACSYKCRDIYLSRLNQKYPQVVTCKNCGKNFDRGIKVAKQTCSKACQYQMFSTQRKNVNIKVNISYSGIHRRIEKLQGKPKKCWDCGLEDKKRWYHWANLDRKYNTNDLTTWARLCVRCHTNYDSFKRPLTLAFKQIAV